MVILISTFEVLVYVNKINKKKARAPLGGALYARKCFFSKDEAFVRHAN
jgi:hypothetical protein